MKQAQNLSEMRQKFSLSGASKIQVTFKQNKVTASCRIGSVGYGSSGATFAEAMNSLSTRIREHKVVSDIPRTFD
ncbi:MAG: hypothetical protein LBK58_11865 [Prevotellaceae bacterium]|jgi:hypothetical protein|nr:hypothetical protein [Prevotellaceae bacterium]